MWRAAVLAAFFSWSSVACWPKSSVVRAVDGREVGGRFISDEAYAAYLEGSLAEAAGHGQRARAAYERALRQDPDAAEPAARLGALLCVADRGAADRAFAAALRRGSDLETVALSEAECRLARGDAGGAVRSGKRAVALAPGDPEASRLVAVALDRARRPAEAARWRRALAFLSPVEVPAAPLRLEDVLVEESEAAIRASAFRERLTTGELALRAVAAGRVDVSRAVASRVLRADPRDPEARVALLATADLLADDALLVEWARKPPKERERPTRLAARVMAELLLRRVGTDAARAWTEAYESTAPDAATGAARAP